MYGSQFLQATSWECGWDEGVCVICMSVLHPEAPSSSGMFGLEMPAISGGSWALGQVSSEEEEWKQT